MSERPTRYQINHELRLNRELINELRERQNYLLAQSKVALPAEPATSTMFTVSLRFKMHGKRYQFLILRAGNHYFTTGTKKDQQVFSSWETLCEWLEGPEVYDHTGIEILQSSGREVSFETGRIEKLDKGQVPF